jgi:EamA domain-containing membrane protein RarD
MKNSYFAILQVVAINSAAITVFLDNLNIWLTSLSAILAASFTVYKIVKEFRIESSKP